MRALRVPLTETLAYWTVVDENWRPVEPADSYLRHLRLGADRAARYPQDLTPTVSITLKRSNMRQLRDS